MTRNHCSVPMTLAAAALATTALAAGPYTPVSPNSPNLGPGIEPPSAVFGKEYSTHRDTDFAGAGDPLQVVAWDGIGGTADGQDFSPAFPNFPEGQIDATANHGDAWFNAVSETDQAHLIFSIDRLVPTVTPSGGPGAPFAFPSGGPVPLSNGNVIYGAGEISVEHAGAYAPPSTQHGWAKQAEINASPLPDDIDGIEVWGPEPAFTADVDKLSLVGDAASGVSVWNGVGSPYISHAAIVTAVSSLLGPVTGSVFNPIDQREGRQAIDLDALMVLDTVGSSDTFDRDPTGAPGGDEILFSIRQALNPADPSGYYATGAELFLLDASGAVSFLKHGGHTWDKAYALTELRALVPGVPVAFAPVIDVDAIEAIVQVPEPAAALLLVAAAAGLSGRRRNG